MHAEKLCHKWLSDVLSGIHRGRVLALSAIVGGAFRGGKLNVTALGRSLQSRAKVKHNIKRADCLCSNHHLHTEREQIYKQVAHQLVGKNQRPVILVDWSDIDARRKFYLLRAALAVKGRSLTLYEEVHELQTREKRETHKQFLKRLKAVLPEGCIPIIVTDAGFRTPWFRQVLALGWDYVGRVRNRTVARMSPKSERIRAKSLYSQATRKAKLFRDTSLTWKHPFVCSLVLFKAKPKRRKRFGRMGLEARWRTSLKNAAREREPWLLATSLTKAHQNKIVQIYATRMQIEESFRDLKCPRYGLSLCHNRTYKLERMKVLVLIGSLATTFAWLLGKFARAAKLDRQFQANTTSDVNVLSNVFIGIQIFRESKLKIPWTLFNQQINLLSQRLYYVL